MESAELSAKMSFCKRLQVGAVLVKENRILANAWNGTISGLDNSCEEISWRCKFCGFSSAEKFEKCPNCSLEFVEEVQKTSEFVLHAEQNILTFSAKVGISTDGCTLYVTHSPCKMCAKMVAQSGISRVVYKKEYRDLDGIDFLKRVGVEVEKF